MIRAKVKVFEMLWVDGRNKQDDTKVEEELGKESMKCLLRRYGLRRWIKKIGRYTKVKISEGKSEGKSKSLGVRRQKMRR